MFPFILGISISFWALPPFDSYDFLILQLHPDLVNLILLASFALKALDSLIQLVILARKKIWSKQMIRPTYAYTMGYTSLMMSILLVLYFGATMPVIAPIAFVYYLYSYYLEKWLILYYYGKSDVYDGQFLRQVVRSFIYYILLYPVFLLGFLTRYAGIPFFVWIVANLIIIIGGVILFRFIDRRVKNERLILSDSKVSLLKFELTHLENEYRHPLYDYYRDEIQHLNSSGINQH